jgi:hypothetical protein
MITATAAAKLCGVTIKRWRTWNTLGKIPSPIKVGKSLFWKRDELACWIDEGCPSRKHWTVFFEKKKEKDFPVRKKRGKCVTLKRTSHS